MRTLYHGSWTVVDRPEAARGRCNLDFGRGFYLTELRSQAECWARLVAERKARDGTARLNVYRFDDMDIITAEQALGQLRYKAVNHQLCIVGQEALDRCLRFVEAVALEPGTP